MSRRKTYRIMENNNLSVGSNAIDGTFFYNNNNDVGFFEQFAEKSFAEAEIFDDVSALAGIDTSNWLMEMGTINDYVHNVNNSNFKKIDNAYSLDGILNNKPMASPSNSSILSTNFIDSPVGSPLSSSDESSYDLGNLLQAASPEDVLSSNSASSDVPLVEHMYTLAFYVDMGMDAQFSPMSDVSEISASEVSSSDGTEDFLDQFLNNAFNETAVVPAAEQPIQEEIDFPSLSTEVFKGHLGNTMEKECLILEEYDVPEETKVESHRSNNEIRFAPYKTKQKTPEQKLRKKSQNRSAAIKYRTKKKNDLEEIFAEADALEAKNKDLKDKVGGLKKEIDYLKNLMLDVIKARLSK